MAAKQPTRNWYKPDFIVGKDRDSRKVDDKISKSKYSLRKDRNESQSILTVTIIKFYR